MKIAKRGLILGKFMPLHTGHLYLIHVALSLVDELTIVIDIPHQNAEIPQTLRYAWLRELAPQASIVCLPDENPQAPEEDPHFWAIWRNSLTRLLTGQLPDIVFASEHYGIRLAEELGARFMPIDINRTAVPISASKIRADPDTYWQFLPPPVKAFYCQRISIFGAESTGKTTLAKKLSQHYSATYVPEYARTLLELQHGQIQQGDFLRIAAAQAASEDALARQGKSQLICDTDPLATLIWHEVLADANHPDYENDRALIAKCAATRPYTLTLLCDTDVPWVADTVRYCPENRRLFFQRCQQVLEEYQRPYQIISGDWEQRWEGAVLAVGVVK